MLRFSDCKIVFAANESTFVDGGIIGARAFGSDGAGDIGGLVVLFCLVMVMVAGRTSGELDGLVVISASEAFLIGGDLPDLVSSSADENESEGCSGMTGGAASNGDP